MGPLGITDAISAHVALWVMKPSCLTLIEPGNVVSKVSERNQPGYWTFTQPCT